MNTAFLGLGSNLGNKQKYIQKAIEALGDVDAIEVITVAPLYQNKAVSTTAQPDFLNTVAKIMTILTPDELLVETQKTERQLGQTPDKNLAPRYIDIDILLYNDILIGTDTLIIPHPLLQERDFVLKPLSEIAPEVVHPIYDKTILELSESLREMKGY